MSTTAKLIYGYLIHPAQKRYKDKAGREYVCCYSSDLDQLANHTRATIRSALLELQEHGLLSDYKIRSRPQRYYVQPIASSLNDCMTGMHTAIVRTTQK